MRQSTLSVVLILVLSAVGLAACSGGGNKSTVVLPASSPSPTLSAGETGIRFTIADECSDNKRIQHRFFHFRNGYSSGSRADMVWPSGNGVYIGGTQGLACDSGVICYGGNARGGDASEYWGIGLDGNHPPSGDVCPTCPQTGIENVTRRALCPDNAGGTPTPTPSPGAATRSFVALAYVRIPRDGTTPPRVASGYERSSRQDTAERRAITACQRDAGREHSSGCRLVSTGYLDRNADREVTDSSQSCVSYAATVVESDTRIQGGAGARERSAALARTAAIRSCERLRVRCEEVETACAQ